MQFVGKMFSSVTDFYKDINPSTLSGAVDIVVVQDGTTTNPISNEDKSSEEAAANRSINAGNDREEAIKATRRCTPFYVRFGKLQLLRAQDRRVEIAINGVPIISIPEIDNAATKVGDKEAKEEQQNPVDGIDMKVGVDGETFFVLPVPRGKQPPNPDLLTSPLMRAQDGIPPRQTSNDDMSAEDNNVVLPVPTLNLSSSTTLPSASLSSSWESLGLVDNDDRKVATSAAGNDALSSNTDNTDKPSTSLACAINRILSDSELELTTFKNNIDASITKSPTARKKTKPRNLRKEPSVAAAAPSIDSSENPTPENDNSNPPIVEDSSADQPSAMTSRWLELYEVVESAEFLGSSLSRLSQLILLEGGPKWEARLYRIPRGTHLQRTAKWTWSDGMFHEHHVLGDVMQVINQLDSLNSLPQYLQNTLLAVYPTTAGNNKSGDAASCLLTGHVGVLCLISWCLTKKLPGKDALLEHLPPPSSHLMNHTTELADLPPASLFTAKPPSTQLSHETATTTSRWRAWWRGSSSSPATSPNGSTATEPLPTALAPPSSALATSTTAAFSAAKTTADQGHPSKPESRKHQEPQLYFKSIRLPANILARLPLRMGTNEITFTVQKAVVSARIYLFDSTRTRLVVSDVDGTITKSDAMGHLMTMVGKDWTHPSIAALYTQIARNGYAFLYLTSRSVGQAAMTRAFLSSVKQDQQQFVLPEGPLILNPDRLFAALHREVFQGNPEEFKIAALQDIQQIFSAKTDGIEMSTIKRNETSASSPFYAGFGNRINDVRAYSALGIPPWRIFTVNPAGIVSLHHHAVIRGRLCAPPKRSSSSTSINVKDALAEANSPTSSSPSAASNPNNNTKDNNNDQDKPLLRSVVVGGWGTDTSYSKLIELVDAIFPPLSSMPASIRHDASVTDGSAVSGSGVVGSDAALFGDWAYWRASNLGELARHATLAPSTPSSVKTSPAISVTQTAKTKSSLTEPVSPTLSASFGDDTTTAAMIGVSDPLVQHHLQAILEETARKSHLLALSSHNDPMNLLPLESIEVLSGGRDLTSELLPPDLEYELEGDEEFEDGNEEFEDDYYHYNYYYQQHQQDKDNVPILLLKDEILKVEEAISTDSLPPETNNKQVNQTLELQKPGDDDDNGTKVLGQSPP